MTVLVTGAHGTVGTAVTEHLDPGVNERVADRPNPPALVADRGFEFRLLDRVEPAPSHPHAESAWVAADVTDYDAIRPAFEGVDAVVHLAGATGTGADWESVLSNNVVGTHNVLEAARDAGVERLVFASTNHVVGMYERERAPEVYFESGFSIDEDARIRPDSEYGASKAAGEAFCAAFAENHGLRVYALRIGSVRDPPWDHPFGDAERGVARGDWERGGDAYRERVARLKCTWLSRRDLAHLVDACLRDSVVTFEPFYGVSDNRRTWLDIGNARQVLDYDPTDQGEKWDAPPAWSGTGASGEV